MADSFCVPIAVYADLCVSTSVIHHTFRRRLRRLRLQCRVSSSAATSEISTALSVPLFKLHATFFQPNGVVTRRRTVRIANPRNTHHHHLTSVTHRASTHLARILSSSSSSSSSSSVVVCRRLSPSSSVSVGLFHTRMHGDVRTSTYKTTQIPMYVNMCDCV